MHWFKHQTRARHDPFIWDLRQRFGGEGYFVYFATVEIYADSFKPSPGWFLDVSVAYLKNQLGIYHRGKLFRMLDYCRSWPDVDGTGYRPTLAIDPAKIGARSGEDRPQSFPDLCDIVPKWVLNLSRDRVSLLIPNFVKIMDEYTRKKVRKQDEVSGQSPDSDRNRPDAKQSSKEKNPEIKFAKVFRDIAKDCETLALFPPVRGRRFPGRAFVGYFVKQGVHPGAIRDGTGCLIDQWAHASKEKGFDPWAYGESIVKSKKQFYQTDPVDAHAVKAVFGGFFSG